VAPLWYPDWSGCVAAIIASGPSAKKTDISILSQKSRIKTIAIKESHHLCKPDVIYGCDAHWWRHNIGLPDFSGIRVAYDKSLGEQFPNIRLIDIATPIDKVLLEPTGQIGSGGNSGFQALNLAIQFGARLILLVGFDMHDKSGVHWYGRNNWPQANNPGEPNFQRWRQAFNVSAPIIANAGIDVVNVTRYSELKCFRFLPSIEVAMAEWKM
jgi:hypothetical protein